ncbi:MULTISPECIES: glycoside hydrolase family 12 protein [unclassified Streptomyces]|uniref:glycoside hydrolase family 12 protein n=1 Tax=unclassified Streptomyces TaxID=2593676 RepID=UPI00403CB985
MATRKPGRVLTAVLAPVVALGATVALASAPASAAVWSSCDQWGSTTLNGYTLYNDIWGSGAGSQCIWANSGTNWGVNANHPNTGGIKAYPNAKKVIGKSITSLGSLKSSYNVTVPSSGAYNTSYDIWDTNYAYEIMLWVNRTGAVGPLGTSQGSLTLGGSTWTVYKGNNGANDVFSFVRSSNSSSGTIDILPILKWIKDTKGWFGNVTIGDLQFGFEITSSSGGLAFTTNSESVTSS